MNWKDLFEVTRRERRGSIVLMALIALVLAVTAFFRYCSPSPRVDVTQPGIERFEQQIDSVKPLTPAHKSPVSTRKRHNPSRKEKGKPSGQRRLEPVPQI